MAASFTTAFSVLTQRSQRKTETEWSAERVVAAKRKKRQLSVDGSANGSRLGRLPELRAKICEAWSNFTETNRRCRRSSGSIDIQSFEDPDKMFVQLVSSVANVLNVTC